MTHYSLKIREMRLSIYYEDCISPTKYNLVFDGGIDMSISADCV